MLYRSGQDALQCSGYKACLWSYQFCLSPEIHWYDWDVKGRRDRSHDEHIKSRGFQSFAHGRRNHLKPRPTVSTAGRVSLWLGWGHGGLRPWLHVIIGFSNFCHFFRTVILTTSNFLNGIVSIHRYFCPTFLTRHQFNRCVS